MAIKIQKRRFGWKRDSRDDDDYHFAPTKAMLRRLPLSYDLLQFASPVIDQGQLGSCTGCSSSGAFELLARKEGKPFNGSELFAYWNARRFEGTTGYDSGAEIRDAIKGLAKFGLASAQVWPYDVRKAFTRPSTKAFREGLLHQALRYERVDNSDVVNVKAAVASGCPVVFGFTVYESFERIGPNGKMPMPKRGEKQLGGHAIFALGYDDARDALRIRNSWSADWGYQGDFWMPYAFVENHRYCADFWKLEVVE